MKKIFIALDTSKLSEVKKIIKNTHTNKIKFGYKFGIQFFNSKYGRQFISKLNMLYYKLKYYFNHNFCYNLKIFIR